MSSSVRFMMLQLLVFLLFTRLNNARSNTEHESASLIKFKASINDPLSSLDNWNFNKSVCQWFGVSCSSGGRVTALSLQSLQLSGEFPTALLQELSHLRSLTISNNTFTGSISNIFKNCTLEVLDLSSNKFSGILINDSSSARCRTLKFLNISYNAFSGQMILDRDKFNSLEVLDGSHNKLSGEVPMLQSLKRLNLSSNKFNKINGNGSICSKTSALEHLIVANNVLSGSILDSVMSCSRLQILDLSVNSLTGTIPVNFCKSLPKLQHMHVWSNKIEGYLPSSMGDCSSLYTLILNYNNLQGTIPHELSKLHNIVYIILSSNNLTGEIPPSLGQLQNLLALVASNNSLIGEIPREFANCSSLTWLDLNMNQLTGSIPPYIGRTNRGLIQFDFLKFKWMKRATVMNLYHACQGKGMDELFILIGIDMDEVKRLPMVCQGRVYMFTSQTRWLPDVESPLLIDFSHNMLSGKIPEEFGKMKTLFQLNLAHNQLDGPIPSNLTSIIYSLDLSENSLSGQIPDRFSQLSYLVDFNVSHNNLSGLIPQNGQLTTFQVSSYQGNPGLCGIPLGECPVGIVKPGGTVGEEDDSKAEVTLVAVVVGTICFAVWMTAILYWGSSLDRCFA